MKLEVAICPKRVKREFSLDDLISLQEKVKELEVERRKREEIRRREEEMRRARFLYD